MTASLLPTFDQITPVQKVLARLRQDATTLFTNMLGVFTQHQRFIFQNPDHIQAVDIVAGMGTSAGQYFESAERMVAYAASLGKTLTVVPPGWSYVKNPNGTVALTRV